MGGLVFAPEGLVEIDGVHQRRRQAEGARQVADDGDPLLPRPLEPLDGLDDDAGPPPAQVGLRELRPPLHPAEDVARDVRFALPVPHVDRGAQGLRLDGHTEGRPVVLEHLMVVHRPGELRHHDRVRVGLRPGDAAPVHQIDDDGVHHPAGTDAGRLGNRLSAEHPQQPLLLVHAVPPLPQCSMMLHEKTSGLRPGPTKGTRPFGIPIGIPKNGLMRPGPAPRSGASSPRAPPPSHFPYRRPPRSCRRSSWRRARRRS